MLELITPLILTRDEAPNLERTLAMLAWARRIVVIDSGSTDETLEILARYPAVEVYRRKFDSFAAQTQAGLEKVNTPFTLSLDADYVLSLELVAELRQLRPDQAQGWYADFTYCVIGRPLRASLLPPRLVLHETRSVRYVDDGHAHRAVPPARTARLEGRIMHDDRKPLSRWVASQVRYSQQEADKLEALPWRELTWPDRCRRSYLAPLLVPAYCVFGKALFLDGWAGIYYALQRTLAEVLIALRLLGRRGAGDRTQ